MFKEEGKEDMRLQKNIKQTLAKKQVKQTLKKPAKRARPEFKRTLAKRGKAPI
jgi:hypothetical protein